MGASFDLWHGDTVKRCGICRVQCRKRSAVYTINALGFLVRALACEKCKASAMVIVPRVVAAGCECGKPATVCKACASDRARKPGDVQKRIAEKIRRLAKAYDATARLELEELEPRITEGRIAGLMQAADLVEAEP